MLDIFKKLIITQQLYSWVFILEKWKFMYTCNLDMNVFAVLFVIPENWKQASVLHWVNGEISCGTSIQKNRTQQKKEWTIDTQNNLVGSQGHLIEWNKPFLKVYILYDAIYMAVLK